MFTSAAILRSYFGEERSGRGGEGGGGTSHLIHAYVRWGCHWTSKCMGHIESKIKFEGSIESIYPIFLLVRLPY